MAAQSTAVFGQLTDGEAWRGRQYCRSALRFLLWLGRAGVREGDYGAVVGRQLVEWVEIPPRCERERRS